MDPDLFDKTEDMFLRIEEDRDTLRAQLKSSQADVKLLREALAPFAAYLEGCSDVPGSITRDDVGLWQTAHHPSQIPFTHGDVRRAATALAATAPKEGE